MRLLSVLAFISLTLSLERAAFANGSMQMAHALVINQVRGGECCQQGSPEFFQKQIETSERLQLPTTFLLRYDALINGKYKQIIEQANPDYINFGIFLEITPELAKKAKVKYRGNQDTWYEAQNAYPIGYSPIERIKLANELINAYTQIFATTPKISGGWIVDTHTLNYLHKVQGVQIHQITREQWGTDSYTLDGGPVHYPYPASENWAFIPDYYKQTETLLIVRQTVSDPLLNYGDRTNTYTSQPNDYRSNGKDFNYFTGIVNQAINQPQGQIGFVLLGLENSMSEKDQEEFVKQLEYLKQLANEGKLTFPKHKDLSNFWMKQKVNLYCGDNSLQRHGRIFNTGRHTTCWINTPNYRIRLRTQEVDDQVKLHITDVRPYDRSFQDPYLEMKAQKEGFWVVPYLINGARTYQQPDTRNFWQKFWGEPQPWKPNLLPHYDQNLEITQSLKFNLKIKKSLNILKEGNQAKFSFATLQKNLDLTFNENNFLFKNLKDNNLVYQEFTNKDYPIKLIKNNNIRLQWQLGDKIMHALDLTCKNGQCIGSFSNKPNLQTMRKEQYPYLFPEPIARPLSPQYTVLYASNQYAVARVNPARLVFTPYDKMQVPTILDKSLEISSNPEVSYEKTITYDKTGEQFIDFYSNNPIQTKVTIKYYDFKKEFDLYFAPNCKVDLWYCLRHPIQALWYLNAVKGNRSRGIR